MLDVEFPVISSQLYTETLSKTEKTVSEKVKAYLKDPNEANVHDLRTSVRRLTATIDILPKKIRRSKDCKKFLDGYEQLLKANTKVRDIDVVLSKLPNHGDDAAYAKLAGKLTHVRESILKRARRTAASIKDVEFSLKPEDVSASTIQKHFRKTANSLAKKLNKGVQTVKKDPKNAREIHKLREDSRRLRFTLEMDKTPETSKLLPVLESWQNVLGAIRDSDIFIRHFAGEKDPSAIKVVVEREKSRRKENFERFLKIAKESPSFK